MLPLEDQAAKPLLAPLPEPDRFASWHLVRLDGGIASRGAAGIELLETLGYVRSSRAAAHIAGPVERLYSFVSGHRDKLGRLVPDGPAPRRFP